MKKLLSLLLVLTMFCPLISIAETETITIINCDKVNIRNEKGQSLGRVGCYTPVTVGETKDDSTYVTVLRAYLELSQDNYELDDFINTYSGDISGWVKNRCLTEISEDMDSVIRKAEEYRWEFWVDGIYHEIKNDTVIKNKSYETHSTPTVEMVPIDSRFLRNSSPNSIYNRISKAQQENPNNTQVQQDNTKNTGVQDTQSDYSEANDNDGVINLNNYIKIRYEGYDGAGRSYAYFDKEQFFLDNINKIKYNSDNFRAFQEYYGYYNYRSAASAFLRFVSFSPSYNYGLANGDHVNIAWEIDKKRINDYFILDYKYSPKSFTVSGLTEPEPFDPFDDLVVDYEGYSNNAIAYVYSPHWGRGSYDITPNGNLKNGDTITIKFNNDRAYCISNYGKFPTRDTIEYTVSDLADNPYIH